MRLSRFVVVYERVGDDENVIYDVVSDRFAGIDDEVLALLRRLGDGEAPADEEEAEVASALAEQGFLVEDRAADDRRLAAHLASAAAGKPDTMFVSLMPTLVCNLACTYCFQQDSPAFNRMTAENEAASIDFVLRRVDAARTSDLVVHYFGGEALTRKDFVLRTAEALGAAMAARGGTFSWRITTNAVDLDRPFVEAMNKTGEGTIKVTLDGDRETHDRARVYRGGKGSFDVVFDNLVAVAGSVRLLIGGNFYPGQEASYERLIDRLEDAGAASKIESIKFKPVLETVTREAGALAAESAGCAGHETDVREEAAALVSLDRLVRKKRRTPHQSKTLEMLRGPCELHWGNNYIIDPDGLVYRCPAVAGRPEVAVGSVKDDALAAAPLLEHRPWEHHEPCHDCAYLPVCMGGCLAGQYLRTGRRDQVLCKKEWFEAGFAEAVPRRYLEQLGAVPWDGAEAKAAPPPSLIDTTEGSTG